MVRIGFDDEEVVREEPDEEKLGNISEFKKRTTIKIPERRIKEMEAEFDCVVVQEFGDDYHLTEEEREAQNKFYKVFREFSKCKHKFRQLDKWVTVMREALKCLDYVSENNGVYEPEEFRRMVFSGEIVLNGWFLPAYVGPGKKQLNMEYMAEFVLSDRPVEEILPDKVDEIYDDGDYERMSKELFTEEQLKHLSDDYTEEENKKFSYYFDPTMDRQLPGQVLELSEKESRKLTKACPEIALGLKEMRISERKVREITKLGHEITNADMEEISEYDAKHNYQSTSDVPEFKGDISNDDDYYRYMWKLRQWEMDHVTDDYHGKRKTLGEIEELELKQVLEQNDWNIRAMFGNPEKEKQLEKLRKKESKNEEKIKNKLIEIQNRNHRRTKKRRTMRDEFKSKKKKKKHKESKEVKQFKKEESEAIDDFLLGVSSNLDKRSFKEYKEDVTDMTWDFN